MMHQMFSLGDGSGLPADSVQPCCCSNVHNMVCVAEISKTFPEKLQKCVVTFEFE